MIFDKYDVIVVGGGHAGCEAAAAAAPSRRCGGVPVPRRRAWRQWCRRWSAKESSFFLSWRSLRPFVHKLPLFIIAATFQNSKKNPPWNILRRGTPRTLATYARHSAPQDAT